MAAIYYSSPILIKIGQYIINIVISSCGKFESDILKNNSNRTIVYTIYRSFQLILEIAAIRSIR